MKQRDEKLDQVAKEKQAAVDKERVIAQSLRDRIGHLEDEWRAAKRMVTDLTVELNSTKKELQHERDIKASQDNALARQLHDARESLVKEKRRTEQLERALSELQRDKIDVESQSLALRQQLVAGTRR